MIFSKPSLTGFEVLDTSVLPSTSKSSTGSCENSCNTKSKTAGASCYCDAYSLNTQYADYCSDIAVYCPDVWNVPSNQYKTIKTTLTGDSNNDGCIDYDDLRLVADAFDTQNLIGDLNKDNKVDVFDLTLVGSNYGYGKC